MREEIKCRPQLDIGLLTMHIVGLRLRGLFTAVQIYDFGNRVEVDISLNILRHIMQKMREAL